MVDDFVHAKKGLWPFLSTIYNLPPAVLRAYSTSTFGIRSSRSSHPRSAM